MDEKDFEQSAPANAFCTNCGAKLPGSVAFCGNCGAKQPVVPVSEPIFTPPVYSAPAQSQPVEQPSGMPVGSFVMMGFLFMALLFNYIQFQVFSTVSILYAVVYVGMLVSFILHKKNVYFIAGICWIFMILLEIQTISQSLLYANSPVYSILQINCYLLIALGFFLARTKANIPLRIVGGVFGLILETVHFLILITSRRFGSSYSYLLISYLTSAIIGFSLYMSVLLVKPNTK